MTAVQGIPFVSPGESERLPAKDVKSKGEISPFEKLLTRETTEDKPKSENPGTERTGKSEKPELSPEKEGPRHPRFYSVEKLNDLLRGTFSSQDIAADSSPENNSPPEGSLTVLNSEQDIRVSASHWETELITQTRSENLKKIIALLLKGEIGMEELAKLTASGETAELNPSMTDGPLLREIKERLAPQDEQQGKSLEGILTEEGELVYFDNRIADARSETLKGQKETSLKGTDFSRNKAVMEINVTDLRDRQNAAQSVSVLEHSQIKASLDGERTDSADSDLTNDLLGTPAEKLFSPEGGGGRLEAPVSREVARMFQDYMKDTGSRDLVKKMDFVLKNDNQGEIKLILKPESLGNVRINLSLNENNIAGKIFVDNSSVRDIFLNNMNQIINQLKANGYDNASLEVWVGQDGQNGRNGRQESEEDKAYRIAERIKRFDQSVPQAVPGGYVNEGEVNLVI